MWSFEATATETKRNPTQPDRDPNRVEGCNHRGHHQPLKALIVAALFTYLLHRPKAPWLAALFTLALVANTLATNWLNESYALSRFPVPYFQAQISFNAAQLKGWYAQLVEWDTMDLYLRTQYIDHLFILTVLVLHVVALLWGSRLFPANHRGRCSAVVGYCAYRRHP